MSLPNLSVLEAKCKKLGLDYLPKDGKKLGKQHCVDALRAHFLPPEGLPYPEITPMLCFAEWNLKPEELTKCHRSPSWAAQVKLNGFRLVMHFVKGVGIFAHTRTISVKTFRYEEMSDKFLIKGYVPEFDASFDLEAMIEKPVDTSKFTTAKGDKGSVTKTSLHSAVAVAHLNAEGAIALQKEQDAPFIFHVFDVMGLDGQNLIAASLKNRERFRATLAERIKAIPELAPYFVFPELIYADRVAFRDKILADGGEGVIWKNLDSPYIASSSRPRTGWVKCKKRVDFDAFVTGFKRGEPGTAWENMVGALEFSVLTETGEEHVLGYPTNLSFENRTKITKYDPATDTVFLHPSMFGRVAQISGQDISARELRLSHCTLDRWRHKPGSPDHKSKEECTVNMQELRDAAEWVG